MPKIFNRAVQIGGEQLKVGTPVVTVESYDKDGNVTYAYGASVPTDADRGYAKGCIFVATGGGVGTTFYINEGSATSADFNLISAAGGGATTWDQLIALDTTLDLSSGATLTIDRSVSNANDVLTLTNSGGGSGDVLQITNVGTGKDINGTSGTWSFSKLGAGTALSMTLSGTEGSNSLVLTAGDVSVADGSVTVVDDDDAASLSVTNNTATTASVFVFAGSGTFTGSTTTSFFTITPSGLTTGTAVYIPGAALTTGKLIHAVSDTVTSGILVHIASAVASTTLTGAGRLFKVDHTGNATGTGILSEFNSAAADETVIVKVTASAALAAGVMLQLSGVSVTTGKAIEAADLNALTTGIGLHIASSATAITGAGRLVYVNHTGVSGTSATLVEFASAAADETVIVKVTASAALAAGVMLSLSGASVTTGKAIAAADLNALTTGMGLHIASSATAITGAGRLVYVNHTGATSTSGTLVEVASAANDETIIMQITASDVNALGSALVVSTATTTGTGIKVTANAVTTGQAVLIQSSVATTVLTTTGRLFKVDHTGNATGSGIIAEVASAAADETVIFKVTASAALAAGVAVDISAASMTTGTALDLGDLNALTTGKGINVVSNSADTGAFVLVNIKNDNALATGGLPLVITNDSPTNTNFFKAYKLNSTTFYIGNGTTSPNTVVTGSAGDVAFNCDSGKAYYCTGTTNWTAFA